MRMKSRAAAGLGYPFFGGWAPTLSYPVETASGTRQRIRRKRARWPNNRKA